MTISGHARMPAVQKRVEHALREPRARDRLDQHVSAAEWNGDLALTIHGVHRDATAGLVRSLGAMARSDRHGCACLRLHAEPGALRAVSKAPELSG